MEYRQLSIEKIRGSEEHSVRRWQDDIADLSVIMLN